MKSKSNASGNKVNLTGVGTIPPRVITFRMEGHVVAVRGEGTGHDSGCIWKNVYRNMTTKRGEITTSIAPKGRVTDAPKVAETIG